MQIQRGSESYRPGGRLQLTLLFILWLPAAAHSGTIVWLDEQESGVPVYPVRMLVTGEYLRIDDGVDDGDFVLFERTNATVYSVNHEDRRALVVKRRDFSLPKPLQFEHKVEAVPLPDSPGIAGHGVTLYRYYTNSELCFEVASASDLLPDVIPALAEFAHTLASEHAAVAAVTPADLQSGCDLADLVFSPGRYLEHGFPVNQRTPDGRIRVLRRFSEDADIHPSLFVLPAGYSIFHTGAP